MEPRYTLIEEEQGQTLNMRDMLASVLLGWKLILCCLLAGMILLGGLGFKKALNQKNSKSTPETNKVTSLREQLSDTEANEVEKVFNQYQIYQNYISSLSQYSSANQNIDVEKVKMKIVKYYVVSRIKYIYTFYTEMAVSSDDFEKIDKIAYPDDESADSSKKKVSPLRFFSEYHWENVSYIAEPNQDDTSKEATLVTAFICADTEDQCEEIQKVVDDAFQKETQTLREVDPDIICRLTDAHYSANGKEYYDSIERVNVDRLNVVNNALSNMKNNFIDKFSDKQKNYFDCLRENALIETESSKESLSDESIKEENTESSLPVKKILKYAIVGAMAGCFLAGCWLSLSYVINNKIKTSDEMRYYGIPIFDTLYYEKNGNLFRRLARIIRGITPSGGEVQEHMLAEDISILMEKNDCKSLYILMTSDADEDKKLADNLQKLLAEDDRNIIIGNPLISPEELKKLAETDRVILLVHAKDTRRDSVKRAKEICDRYHKQIFGTVAIEMC